MTSSSLVSAAARLLARCDVASDAPALIEMLAREIGWDAGEIWLADAGAVLRMTASWYATGIDAAALRAAGRALVCRPGEGLPGNAAKSGIVIWVDTMDVSTLLRARELAQAGFVSAVAIPMQTRDAVPGVLLFFSRAVEKLEQPLIDELSDLASVMGELYQARKASDELQQTAAKLQLLLEATAGVAWTAGAEAASSDVEAMQCSLEASAGTRLTSLAGERRTLVMDAHGRTWSARVAPLTTEKGTIAVGVATDITAEERRTATLRRVADAAMATGPSLFALLASELANAMGTEIAIIAVVDADDRALILGGVDEGRPFPRTSYDFHNAPCADTVASRETLICVTGAASRWSSATTLEMGVDGYIGHPLIDSCGRVLGVAAAMSRRPLSLHVDAETVLRIVASRAAAELERMRLDQTMRAAEERHRAVAEALDDAVITIDHDGIIESVNAATTRIFGYTPEELIGANVSLLMPGPHAEQHAGYIRRYLATGTSRIMSVGRDVAGRRRDGSEVCLRLTLREVRLPTKRLFTGILRDLAETVEARQALQRSRTIIADTQRLTHIGNWVWNIETNVLEWSDEIYRIFGRERSNFEPTYPNFLECVHPEDRHKVETAVAEALTNGTTYVIEHRVVRPNRSEATVHERGELQFENGSPARMIGTVQDVTERQLSHDRLSKLSSAIEQTADQVLITDREGRIEYVNPAFERVSGYSRESLLGQTPRVLKSGHHTLAFYKNVWTKLLAGQVYRGVFINRCRDGAIVYEEKTIAPIRDAAGAITHFISTGRDITDRRRAEQEQEELRLALQLSATEWRLTFDAIEFPIFVCGRDGAVHRANAAAQKLSGMAFVDLIGARLDVLPRCQPWTGAAGLLPLAAGGEPVSAQVQEPVARRTWELAAVPFSRDSDVSLIIVIARDLTALLELQESVRRTEVMSTLGALVAGVAHEVRNPLFAISATIDAFEGRALDQELFDQFTARLRGELVRLTELMRDLLEYGRPTDAELRLGTLRDPIGQALRTTESLASALSVTLDADIEGSDLAVMLDVKRFQVALRNLLDNAVRHAGEGGRVSLSIVPGDDHVEVTIRDSGAGFVESDIPHLFEPFFTRRRGGTGLGLSIVHRTIEEHGGSIVAENHPSGGAMMRLRLPLAGQSS